MRLVYVAHPFGGKKKNIKDAQEVVRQLVRQKHGYVFLSPLQALGFLNEDISYEESMEMCLQLLKRCDELWLCNGWEKSKGCNMEWAAAKALGIPIYKVDTQLEKNLLGGGD